MERLDQGHIHPETDMSQLEIEPRPPWWEASTLAKSYSSSVLKVLASERDPAKIRLILLVVIKERGVEVFWKNPPVPHTVSS